MKRSLGACLLGLFACLAGHSEEPPPTLRVLAYNIRHGRGMDGNVDIERIARVIESQKPDLVALQEVDKLCERGGRIDMARILGERLNMNYRFGRAIDLQGGEYGNAVLSRFPILETRVHALPESAEQRVALEVEIQIHEERLSFVSLHLESASEQQRSRQAKSLIDRFAKKTHPILLAGDFNAIRGSEPMQQFVEAGWTVLRKNDGNGIQTVQGNQNGRDPRPPEHMEIDFMVIRNITAGNVVHGVVPEFTASDHRPIHAQFDFISREEEPVVNE